MSELTLKFTEKEHQELMDVMSAMINIQDDPKVGIFWLAHTPVSDDLIGVHTAFADDIQFNDKGIKTVRDLHRCVWEKYKNRDLSKGKKSLWLQDYTKIPRGRVCQQKSDMKFYVTVGSWINEYSGIKERILEEFDLPSDAVFVCDSRWDVGQEWSE
jgi:hypothetical protein